MLELNDNFLPEFLIQSRHGDWAGLVGQKIPIIRPCQVQLQICTKNINNLLHYYLRVIKKRRVTFEGLALDKIEVVRLGEDPRLEPATEPLQVPIVNVEHATLHFFNPWNLITR